jgi:hypothetical protein
MMTDPSNRATLIYVVIKQPDIIKSMLHAMSSQALDPSLMKIFCEVFSTVQSHLFRSVVNYCDLTDSKDSLLSAGRSTSKHPVAHSMQQDNENALRFAVEVIRYSLLCLMQVNEEIEGDSVRALAILKASPVGAMLPLLIHCLALQSSSVIFCEGLLPWMVYLVEELTKMVAKHVDSHIFENIASRQNHLGFDHIGAELPFPSSLATTSESSKTSTERFVPQMRLAYSAELHGMVRFHGSDRQVVENAMVMSFTTALVQLPRIRYLDSGVHTFCFRVLSCTPDEDNDSGLGVGFVDIRQNPAHIDFNEFLPRSRRCWFYECLGQTTSQADEESIRYGTPYATGAEIMVEINFDTTTFRGQRGCIRYLRVLNFFNL